MNFNCAISYYVSPHVEECYFSSDVMKIMDFCDFPSFIGCFLGSCFLILILFCFYFIYLFYFGTTPYIEGISPNERPSKLISLNYF